MSGIGIEQLALNAAQVLWEERRALARIAPSGVPNSPAHDPAMNPGEAPAAGMAETIATPTPPVAVAPGGSDRLGGVKTTEAAPNDITDVYRCLNHDNHWALCLSGGGIRSTAFALGVIQRLAAQPVSPKVATDEAGSSLQQFEYLSTVSGGGYIGSWLSAWLYHERERRGGGGANQIVAELNRRGSDYAESGALVNLRRDGRSLAPSLSAISPDLWSDIAAVSRNLCLNWLLLVPPIILAVLVTKAASYVFIDALRMDNQSPWFAAVMITATIGFIAALSFSVANRPVLRLINASQAQFLVCDMTIFLVSAALLIVVLGSPNGRSTLAGILDTAGFEWLKRIPLPDAVLFRGALLGLAIYILSWLSAPLWQRALAQKQQFKPALWHQLIDLGSWCVAGAAFGTMIAAGYLAAAALVSPAPIPAPRVAGLVCSCGLPWIVSARVIADVIFIAFAKFVPGADAGLEYQARSGGILTLAQLSWFIWFGLVLGAPLVEQRIENHLTTWVFAAGGISGALAVIAGFRSRLVEIAREVVELRHLLSLNTLAAIMAAICGIALVAWLSIIMEWGFTLDPFKHETRHTSWPLVLATGAMLVILIVVASLVIGINQYSLHGIYRNRLVRAFLGASRDDKQRDASRNRFTDFDSLDSPLLHQLWLDDVNPRGDNWRPLHVINAAANLVSSKHLAWREQLAAPFTFSPLHCGSANSIFSNGAYRRTHPSADQMRPYGGRTGLTLGTAMAVSGAPVSPDIGYNKSPGVAFLMTLFNVRLGWWLANPRSEKQYWLTSPPVALRPYFMEMFGLTSENERWIYVSDGGHFDNLGIYEMVRRRCRVIVVSDAGHDPDYTFVDLGSALRKVWIDLGVGIEMCGLDRLKNCFAARPAPASAAPYWAVGRIRYKAADGAGEDGLLLYFKCGLHGTEPIDVLSYAMSHPAFPHETSADRYCSESQFESYRRLGFEIVSRAFASAGCVAPGDTGTHVTPQGAELTLDAVIERLYTQLNPRQSPSSGLAHAE
jgi:hypothetical protein